MTPVIATGAYLAITETLAGGALLLGIFVILAALADFMLEGSGSAGEEA